MFEKEAKEYEKRKHYLYEDNDYCGDIADGIMQAYQQGADFGYNKCLEQLTKAKELIEELSSSLSVVGECEEEECELLNRAEQFISEVEKK